jgi:photosystem II stability/assembly factor-like uncharacterized protein
MERKLKLFIGLVVAILIIASCSKDKIYPEPPVEPPPAPKFDTLGAGWQKISGDTIKNYTDIFFVNNQTGFLCAANYIAKSVDGGLTWQNVLPAAFNDEFTNIFFVDASHGWVAGLKSLVRTKDGGATWQRVQNNKAIFDVQFFDANNGFITSDTGGLYRTSDGGLTLDSVFRGEGSRALYFRNQNKGWVSGYYFYRTDNAGSSFNKLLLGSGYAYISDYVIQFTDSLHGWVTGGNLLRRTVDGGTNVEVLISDTRGGGDIHFFDSNNGYIMTGNGIYSTSDGGTTRNKLCSINKSTLAEFHFTEANRGWAIGSKGGLYKYLKP